ncbi:hypothetical protein ABPG73_015868 [Tetrahymena malaccensis]
MKYFLLITLCLISFSLAFSIRKGEQQDKPVLPNQYRMDWDIYTLEQDAPYDPASNFYLQKGKGATYYDFATESMIEFYYDFCIPIFQNPSSYHQFPCRFLNTKRTAYLLIDKPMLTRPPCCVFATEFHPAHPNFIVEHNLQLKGTYQQNGEEVDYYWLDIPPPGPFYYGFHKYTTPTGHRVPAGFAFPTEAPENFTQQVFYNFQEGPFDMSVFDIPDSCINAPECVVFSDEEESKANSSSSKKPSHHGHGH